MNDTPDWLDDVLRSRSVDDDGFVGRVHRLDVMRQRATVLRRLLVIIVILAAVPGTYMVLGLKGLSDMTGHEDRSIEGAVWLTQHRERWRAWMLHFDEHPQLRRRAGRDAAAFLEAASSIEPACERKVVCDTSFLRDVGTFDTWTMTPSTSPWPLLTAAKQRLAHAIDAPVVDGEAAPFVVAATEVEAFARLWLTSGQGGFDAYEAVVDATTQARALGRDGGFQPAFTRDELVVLRAVRHLGVAFSSVAATDDDLAFLLARRSVLACSAARNAYVDRIMRGYLDDDVIDRRAVLAVSGCSAPFDQQPAACGEEATPSCAVSLAITRLPPWRQLLVAESYRFEPTYLDKVAATLPAAPGDRP